MKKDIKKEFYNNKNWLKKMIFWLIHKSLDIWTNWTIKISQCYMGPFGVGTPRTTWFEVAEPEMTLAEMIVWERRLHYKGISWTEFLVCVTYRTKMRTVLGELGCVGDHNILSARHWLPDLANKKCRLLQLIWTPDKQGVYI